MRLFLLSIFFSFSLQIAVAQSTIYEQMKWYSLAKPTSNLFVHFDKNIYSNNETVYFTGYLIKEARTPSIAHKVMAVALIRDVDSALIIEDKFLMQNGISFGSINIPDSIPTGNYHFLVYTDKLLNKTPEALFIQHITIKSSMEPSFKANIKLVEANPSNKLYKVMVSATSKDGRFLPKPAQINYRYGKNKKSTLTDASGQQIINLPLQGNIIDPTVYVKLKYERDSTFINMALPQLQNKAIVKFYPEGGNMVNQLASNVSWEVKDLQNRPIALKALLFKDQKIIDTIETNSYGIGSFKLRPEIGFNYSVKLVHANIVDSLYKLPSAISNGLTITVQKALIEDTLKFNLKSVDKQVLTLLVHNFNTCFSAIPFNMETNNITVKLPITEVPKGLTTLTILDSLNRPLAERIFFAHYSDVEKISIRTDQQIYKQREQVKLQLNLKTDENALVSIAAIQLNRDELKNTNDIESYTYLKNELNALPVINNGRAYKSRDYLEQMLLVKSWRRYTWQDLMTINPADTLANLDSLKVNGQITRTKKEISQPLVIGTMAGQNINLINTDQKGFFKLNENDLITPAEKKLYVFVNGAQKSPYDAKMTINDDYTTLNQKLAKLISVDQPILPSNLVNNTELLLKNNEKTIRLKEVIITNKKDDTFRHSGANACGDYVCSYNILNCRNHIGDAGNTQPVKGRIYTIGGSNIKQTYMGCSIPDQGMFTIIKGIHSPKEFYVNNYEDTNEPAFFSTIYWNYGTMLSSKKQTEISFYTSDIAGKFKIVVQGITNNDVVYTEHFFEVKEGGL